MGGDSQLNLPAPPAGGELDCILPADQRVRDKGGGRTAFETRNRIRQRTIPPNGCGAREDEVSPPLPRIDSRGQVEDNQFWFVSAPHHPDQTADHEGLFHARCQP